MQFISLETITQVKDPSSTQLNILLNQETIAEALYKLTPRQRLIFILKEIDGYGQLEIANILNRSRRTIVYDMRKIKNTFAQLKF